MFVITMVAGGHIMPASGDRRNTILRRSKEKPAMDLSWKSIVLLSIAFVLVAGFLLWGVWQLEEAKKGVHTRVVEETDDGLLVVELKEKEKYDLTVQCDEENFQEAFRQFAKHVQADATVPPLTIPGGPLVIALADHELPENMQPVKRAAIEYLKRHAPKRVILLAHSECLLYDTIAAWQNNLDAVKQRQHADLIRARNVLKSWFPKTEVEIYYADRQGDKLTFYPMAETLPPTEPPGTAVPYDLQPPEETKQPEKE